MPRLCRGSRSTAPPPPRARRVTPVVPRRVGRVAAVAVALVVTALAPRPVAAQTSGDVRRDHRSRRSSTTSTWIQCAARRASGARSARAVGGRTWTTCGARAKGETSQEVNVLAAWRFPAVNLIPPYPTQRERRGSGFPSQDPPGGSRYFRGLTPASIPPARRGPGSARRGPEAPRAATGRGRPTCQRADLVLGTASRTLFAI